jgi:hypothetical protein
MKPILFFTLLLLWVFPFWGCNGGSVTVSLPGGATCTGQVTADVTASIQPEPGTGRVRLDVKVCVLCNGQPVAGVTGITAAFKSEVPLPPNVPPSLTFTATDANGCVTRSFILPNDRLRGQQVVVTVVDASGGTVTTSTVTIQ